MARARSIKPGFYLNEDLAECSIWARFMFPGLWMIADREGRLEDRPKRIKAAILPFDNQDVEPLLEELHQHGFLVRYRNEAGSFIQISKFLTHQSPHYSEKPSVIKPPNSANTPGISVDDEKEFTENSHHDEKEFPEDSQNIPENSGNEGVMKRASQPPGLLITGLLIQKPICRAEPDVHPPNEKKSKKNGSHSVALLIKDADSVLVYLNNAVGSDFHLRNPNGQITSNAKLVIDRLSEGYSPLQLREVVFFQAEKWGNDEKMREYLRPDTLFRKINFEKYLGAIPARSEHHG